MTTTDMAVCGFPGHPGPAGHINACQLCPASPTYWRNQPDSPTPAQQPTAQPAPTTPERTGGLDWSSHKAGDRRPCRLCGKPAFARDADGRPCHKVCAEQAGEQPTTTTGPALRLIEGGKR